jgi:hypothetical protein
MNKLVTYFSKYFPYVVLAAFIGDIYVFWHVDQDRVLMDIAGAIGWASFIEVRKDYDSLLTMIEGKTKHDA